MTHTPSTSTAKTHDFAQPPISSTAASPSCPVHRLACFCRVSPFLFKDLDETNAAFEDRYEVGAVHKDQRRLATRVLRYCTLGKP